METISKKQQSKYKMLDVESQQMMGSILTLWNPQLVNLLAAKATRHTLSVNMQIIGNMEEILCTNVYGPQMMEEKGRMLLDLENLRIKPTTSTISWQGISTSSLHLLRKKGAPRDWIEMWNSYLSLT
jgi:hypothetical protein